MCSNASFTRFSTPLLIPALILMTTPAWAGPGITSISGVPGHGQTFTIAGSGFGAHPGSGVLIRVFDDFNDGNLTANAYGGWSVFNGSANPSPVQYSTADPRTSRPGDGHYRRTHVGLGYINIVAGSRSEYYSSFYMRLSDQFDITSASSGTHQFKIVRLWSTNISGAGKINVYPAIGSYDGFHFMFEFIKPDVLRHQAQMDAIPDKPAGWHKMAVYYKKNSAPNANDGKCMVWWDNCLVYNWHSADYDDGNLAGDWSIGNYFSSASTSTYVDFDDIYLSHTLARVELGNASTYAASTVLETQVPTAWSASQITVRANLGTLTTQQPLYLYVTDAAGNVNANGFPLGDTGECVEVRGPYGGTAAAVPGVIEAERFDTGCEGDAYHDADATNAGGAFRTSTGVDIEPTDDAGGGYNVGWTRPGEWLEYTVHVPIAGQYTLDARVASNGAGGAFHVKFDGVDVTGPRTVPDTGGWNNWGTLPPTAPFPLSAGPHTMRISMDTAGTLGWVTELNWVRLTMVDNEPPSIPSGLTAAAISESAIELSWNPSTDDTGVAGYRLDVSTDPSFASLLDAYNNKDVGNGTTTTIAGLAAQTTYHARMRAFDAAGHTSANSTPASVTTQSSGCLTATYPDSRWHNRVFPGAQTGVFTAVADVTPFASNVNAAIGVSSGPQFSWGGLAANVLFFTDGTIKARDADGYPPGVIPYAAGTTYRVRMEIDLATHTYSAYVTAPGGTEQTIGTGLRFRTGQESVTSLDHWTVTSDSGSLRACNFEAGSVETVVLQQGLDGYGGVTDTRISYYDPNVNFGGDGRLLIGGGGAETVKSLVRFDLSAIPAGATISSATLSLYNHAQNGDINPGSVSVHPVSKPWVELQATWHVYATGASWATAGMQAGADYNASIESTITIDESINVWRTFDVTAMVQQWISGTAVNHGFLIRSGTRGVKPYFYSSNHAADPALRPKLVIELAPD